MTTQPQIAPLVSMPASGHRCARGPATIVRFAARTRGFGCGRLFRGFRWPGCVRIIPLTRGLHAIVDAKNYEWLSRHKWSVHDAGRGRTRYAVRAHKGRKIFLHGEIMKTPPGMVVDHINRNGLDNREDNLRNCTRLQNR